MELEDLKSTWKEIKKAAPRATDSECLNNLSRRTDARTRLLRRSVFDITLTSVCLVLMSTERLWGRIQFPVIWIVAACVVIFGGVLMGIYEYKTVRNINLSQDSNSKVLWDIISLRKLYKKAELIFCSLILGLFIWLSFTYPFVGTWRMLVVGAAAIIALLLEYLWYRRYIRMLNAIVNWNKD